MAAAGTGAALTAGAPSAVTGATPPEAPSSPKKPARSRAAGRPFNSPYAGQYLNRVAFPIGGLGAGMFCLEGTGAISHMSVRNAMQVANEPCMFAALTVKGASGSARVVEGPVPSWKIFGRPGCGDGAPRSSYGFPRFKDAVFHTRFPFSTVTLKDSKCPLETELTGWSPFIPGDADNSSPTRRGAGISLQKHIVKTGGSGVLLQHGELHGDGAGRQHHPAHQERFCPLQSGTAEKPADEGYFAIFTDDDRTAVDHCWFKGGWWDGLTLAWKNIQDGFVMDNPPVPGACPGASLFVPFTLAPGAEKTIRVLVAWYVPKTAIRVGDNPKEAGQDKFPADDCCPSGTHIPWYACKFKTIAEVSEYWRSKYTDLREKSARFRDAFYDSTLPPEVIEAAAANLTILKSSTVMRAPSGRLWGWEGCGDGGGCCHGSCTHVWNYAQAIPHLFPDLERSLRETEFHESQIDSGNQTFRSFIPIREITTEGWPASTANSAGS